jgi:hypothetical protein
MVVMPTRHNCYFCAEEDRQRWRGHQLFCGISIPKSGHGRRENGALLVVTPQLLKFSPLNKRICTFITESHFKLKTFPKKEAKC